VADEPSPHLPGASTGALLRAVEELRADARDFRADVREDLGHLRDDVREDNQRLEQRLMAVVADLRAEQRSSIEAHAKLHLEAAIETESELGRIRAFMNKAELDQARRDGALGIFRFAVEQISRHWGQITVVLATFAAAAAAVAGNIRIEVGFR
jgi:hypothetical protein